MRAWISRHLLWLSVFASVAAFVVARASGGPLELVVTLSSLVVLAVTAVLERWMRYRPEWMRPSGDSPTDLASAAVLIGAVDPLLQAALPVAVVALWPGAAQAEWALRFTSNVPFALQVLAVLLWMELAKYGAHRWHHSNRTVEANCNFGSALLLWDHVFGTWRAADTDRGPATLGLFGDGGQYPATRGYLAQLGSMFGPVCCRV